MLKTRKGSLSNEPAKLKPLRLLPGVVIAIMLLLIRYVIPEIAPGALYAGVFGGIFGGLAVVIWWIFFSRAPGFERWFAPVLMIAALLATSQILDRSIATANVGLMFPMFSIPVLAIVFVVWAVATRNLSNRLRRATMVATILVASGFWALLRTDGMDSEVHHDLAWRWAKTPEERFLEKAGNELTKIVLDSAVMATEAEWPGFRGPDRNGIVRGMKFGTDWTKSPPVEIWRRSVGPGCSSFAVHGALLFTQEQRGDYEMVTCYSLETGDPLWRHSDSTRFWDSHAGPGPRSTPTLSKGRVYTLGATGILNVLDERNGTLIWSRDAASDTKVQIPGWGYTSSPLVVDSTVIVAIAGNLAAYDIVTGNPRWIGPDGGESYSSPHLMTIDNVKHILFMNKAGVTSRKPYDGKVLWDLPESGVRVIQPALINENDILVDAGDAKGVRRISIKNGSGDCTIEELWTSNKLRPNHNDLVVHKGHAYGFEGPGLICMDISNGDRKWRGGRYGGQFLLLADQDLLLILSEEGELALVKADPERFEELARFPAIEGKTWNHPVLVNDVLVVRNTQEMAAFRLALEGN